MSDRPRLSRGVSITRRQIGRDEVFFLVKSPRTGAFMRMGEVEAAVLRLLDGRRSLQEVSSDLDELYNYDVPVEAIESFVDSLVRGGIVESTSIDPVAFRQEWETQQRARRKSLGRILGSLAVIKIKLLNPRRLFGWLSGPLRFFWTPGFVFWSLALMLAGGALGLAKHEEIVDSTAGFFAGMTSSAGSFATHAAIFYIVFFIVVAVHETAHGLTCTHFGGKVTDMGFILFYMQIPGFYCDITDAYGFEKRSHRIWVTVAGGYTGLILASVGVFMWWLTEPGGALNDAGIALMIVGGPPLLVFNWNPLIRYDGYYILMDLLEAPNLMGNSYKYLGYLFKSKILRVPQERLEVPQRLRKIYVIYAMASMAFLGPLILFIPVIVYYIFAPIAGAELGFVIAAILGFRVLKRPINIVAGTLRYAWLTHRPALTSGAAGRARGAALAAGSLVGLALLLFGPRFAVRVESLGVVEPWERIEVRAETSGFVPLEEIAGLKNEGEAVEAGTVLVRLENSDLEAELHTARKEQTAARIDMTRFQALGDPAGAAMRRARVTELSEREKVLSGRIDLLALRSPIDGVVLTPRLDQRGGLYLDQGEVWCVVGMIDRLRVRVPLSERDLGLIEEGSPAAIRTVAMPSRTFEAVVERMPPGRTLPLPAPVMTAAAAMTGQPAPAQEVPKEISGSLHVIVGIDNERGVLLPGMTARVRIYGERLTIAGHATRWARRVFKGKIWW